MHSDYFSFSFDASDLRISTSANRIRKRDRAELIPLLRSIHIPTDALDTEAPRWHLRRQINTARALAVVQPRGKSDSRLLTMDAALAIRGLPTWMNVYDIHYRTLDQKKSGRTLTTPYVRAAGHNIPEVSVSKLRAIRLDSRFEVVRGAPVVPLEEAALDLARLSHPLNAYIGVSFAVAELSHFDTFQSVRSRERERQIKDELLQQLGPIAQLRHYRKAAAIIQKSDAGIEVPAEGVLLWLLHILLRHDHRLEAQFESQYPVVVRGRKYRLDIGFPNIGFYIEFDGRGKLIQNSRSAEEWIQRQRDLQVEGWSPLRFTTTNLANIPAMAEVLSRELKSLGLRVLPLGGPLWAPIPNYFRAPDRHY